MAINWEKGLNELGAGLLRQADIGGLAYQDATKKEAERRAETRALSAERRANTQLLATEERRKGEWDRQQLALEQAGIRGEGRQEEVTKRREIRDLADWRTMAGETAEANIQARKDEIKLSGAEWDRQYEAKNNAAVKAATDKAAITALKNIYDKRMDVYKTLLGKIGIDPESPGFPIVHRAQKAVIEAWQDYSVASGLEMREHPEISRLRLMQVESVYAEVVSMDLQQDASFKDFIAALEKGYGPGNEPNKASEDAMKTINDAIERLGIILPKDEKSEMIDDLVKVFLANPDLREGEVTVGDPIPEDGGDGNVSFKRQAGDPIDRIDVENLEVGALKKALADQGRPGKSGTRGTEGAKWRDPEWLKPRLEAELTRLINQRDAPGRGLAGGRAKSSDLQQKITRIQDLILKMEALIPVVNDKSEASLMAVPQRGLIAAVDQGISPQEFDYWEPETTEARAIATQQQGTA